MLIAGAVCHIIKAYGNPHPIVKLFRRHYTSVVS
jgi:hypothetical protein